MPLLVWCPGWLAGGRVVAEPVGVVDVVPTLLELAGLPVPAGLDGLSLVAQLRGELAAGARVFESDVDTSVEFRMGAPRKPDKGFVLALRKARYKLVYDSREGSRRLFDLVADPKEREDVADLHPDVMVDLEPHLAAAIERRRRLANWRAAGAAAPDPQLQEQLRALGYIE